MKPKILVFFVSFNCNLRCAMCYAWVKQKLTKEPGLDEVRAIFNDKTLKDNLEVINITGGEPTLRQDLTEIVRIILENCRRLKRLDISTNGVNTPQVVDQVERILALLLPTDVRLTVNVSLDGVGAIHEQVRQTAGIFNKIEQTIEGLKELKALYHFFDVGLNMTISKLNYQSVEEVKRYAMQKDLGINFTLSAISDIGVESIHVKNQFYLSPREKDEVASCFKGLMQESAVTSDYAKFVITWLKTGKRDASCSFKTGNALLLEPNGEIYACGNFKEFKIGNILEEPLERMVKKISKLKGSYNKCITCNSNCYIDS